MRVVEIAYSLPAEVFIQRHVQALQKIGVDLTLVSRCKVDPRQAGASIGEERPEISGKVMPNFGYMDAGEKLWSLRHLFRRSRHFKSTRRLGDKVRLAFFERLKPDLIHFHTARYAASMAWIPQALGIPYTVSVRGSDIQVLPLRSRVLTEEVAKALCGATLIHAVCDHLGHMAQDLCGTTLPLRTIYTTVPVPSYIPDRGLPDNGLHFLSVGRLLWHKSYVDLLSAVALLRKEGYPVHLTLLGRGEDEPRISWWANHLGVQTFVEFPGKIPASTLPEVFSRSSAFVQSSVAEGFSNAVAEAMAWGCPVFATAVGGTAEVVQDRENGFLLPPLQPERWAEKLSLARERTVMQQVREAAYETARKYFSPQRHAEAFVSFFEEALRRGVTLRSALTPSHIGIQHERADELTSDDSICLLIRGEWRWENGTDQVLRALAPLARDGRVRIIFQGKGPQEDELHYLVTFLGLNASVRFLKDEQNIEAKETDRGTMPVLDIADAQKQGWQLRRNGCLLARVPFGNLEMLMELVCLLDQG